MHAEISGSIRREAAGHDKRRSAPRALGIEGREPLHPVRAAFELGVRRAHEDAVGQGQETEVELAKEVRISGGHNGDGLDRLAG